MSDRLNVLVIGSGGREHALVKRIAESPRAGKIHVSPGNAGIADIAACVALPTEDSDRIAAYAAEHDIGLVVVGPEVPLVAGLADRLEAGGIRVFGPNAAAAILEGSKSFMKNLAAKYGIPTAAYMRFSDAEAAKAYVAEQGAPIVVKADGLAAGKGVTVARTVAEAEAAIDEALVANRFGAAGREIVIEEFMAGEEASFFALIDGTTVVPLGAAQDHKAVGDGDTGPNTGGMGAYSPTPIVTPAFEQRIVDEIVAPLARAMAAEGRPYRGVMFAGLMIVETPLGPAPNLIEINVRFGDPECQVLMARLDSDPLELMLAVAEGRLAAAPPPRWRPIAALNVVLCADGYPGTPVTGTAIRGLDRAAAVEGVTVLHAATKRGPNGDFLAAGGRVLNVVAIGATVAEAQARAYRAVDLIDWPEGFCRRDIGWRAISRENAR